MTRQQQKSFETAIQETLTGIRPEFRMEPTPKLKDAVAEVLNKPRCIITNEQADVEWTTIKTALTEPRSIHKNPLYLSMDVSRVGLARIIETLINTAHEKGPLTAEQMVTVVEDMKVFRANYGTRGTYKNAPEWEIKNEGLTPDKLLCPFCRHTMKDHETIGEATDLNRKIACSNCACTDDLHPALMNLKDKSEVGLEAHRAS